MAGMWRVTSRSYPQGTPSKGTKALLSNTAGFCSAAGPLCDGAASEVTQLSTGETSNGLVAGTWYGMWYGAIPATHVGSPVMVFSFVGPYCGVIDQWGAQCRVWESGPAWTPWSCHRRL